MGFILDENLAYCVGFLVGDGHISNATKSKTSSSKDYRIIVETVDLLVLDHFEKLIKKYIFTKSKSKTTKTRKGKQQSYYFQFRNKLFYLFLTETLNLPNGKKTNKLKIPFPILDSTKSIKQYFIAGFFDSDGGRRGKTYGFTMSNETFQNQIYDILNDLEIYCYKDFWINKIYNKTFYGIKIKKQSIRKFLNEFPIQNKRKLNFPLRGCRSGQTGQIISSK